MSKDVKISYSALGLLKYWQSFLAFTMALAIGSDPLARLVISIPLALWGLFCLTTADIRVREGALEYRRFLKWRVLRHESIRECGRSLIPMLCYLKQMNFVPPWGKIYFVRKYTILRAGNEPILPYFEAQREEFPIDTQTQTSDRHRQAWRWLLALVAGFICSLLVSYLFPSFPTMPSWLAYPALIRVPMQIWERAVTWPWGTITAIALGILSFRDRSIKRGWILAAAIGFMIGEMAVSAIR